MAQIQSKPAQQGASCLPMLQPYILASQADLLSSVLHSQ